VTHQGHTWQAQYWTQGDQPGSAAVWHDQGTCTGSPPTQAPRPCTIAAWNADTIYTGGQEASFESHVWRAQWWTRGETPGVAPVWQDLRPC